MKVLDNGERLFPLFVDATDMVMCIGADASLASINLKAAEHNLRFPLVCEPTETIQAHLTQVEYASGSARFGPFVDNILGMNWELPSGRVVRIGERVIKSTTGYDMVRFLMHTDGRYGRAVSYVLRLRPAGGETFRAVLQGGDEVMEDLRNRILTSSWVHWYDAVDLIVTPEGQKTIELSADCALGERGRFFDHVSTLETQSGAKQISPPTVSKKGIPPLSLKTTSSKAVTLAQKLVGRFGGQARVLCVNGAVHFFPAPECGVPSDRALVALGKECIEQGGHVFGAWAPSKQPNATEAVWARDLEAAWRLL